MDIMNRIFRGYLDSFVIIFIVDILVYSKNKHKDRLRVVLEELKQNQLFAKYKEYEIWLRLVAFIGHFISSEEVEVD